MLKNSWISDFATQLKTDLLSSLSPDIATVKVTIIRDIADFNQWTLPAIAISPRMTDREEGGFGDGKLHFKKAYPCILYLITDGTQESSLVKCQQVDSTVEEFFRFWSVPTIVNDRNETLQDMVFDATQFLQYRKPSSTLDSWYALGSVTFAVTTML